MQKKLSYVIFPTAWGYFGLATANESLYRTCLPMENPEDVQKRLLSGIPGELGLDRGLLSPVQASIQAYFKGERFTFNTSVPLALEGMTVFTRSVLEACARVPCGETTDYAALASQAGSPKAARAVGNAMAKNPMPLIIPCHRVVARSGLIGGFSAPGGTDMKERLLRHEKRMTNL
jgi:methylated-DNA-[protein]-cysteine S-methyltransferase